MLKCPSFALHSFIQRIMPCSYFSICTPHLAARKQTQVKTFYHKVLHTAIMGYSSVVGSLTLKELMLEDKLPEDELSQCILHQMSDPEGKVKQTMNRFSCWMISCLRDDVPVGCSSAASDVNAPLTDNIDARNDDWFVVDSVVNGRVSSNGQVEKCFEMRQAVQKHKIRRSAKPAHDSETSDNSKFSTDSRMELEYSPSMLRFLKQSTHTWTTVYLHFQINSLFCYTVHALAVGKQLYGVVPKHVQQLGNESGTFLCMLVLSDYLDFISSK
jgi:hypothetical protein